MTEHLSHGRERDVHGVIGRNPQPGGLYEQVG
jgi:hypothetical protein